MIDTFQSLSTDVSIRDELVGKRLFFCRQHMRVVSGTCVSGTFRCQSNRRSFIFKAVNSVVFSAVVCVDIWVPQTMLRLHVRRGTKARRNTLGPCAAVVFVLKGPACFVFRHDYHLFFKNNGQCRQKLLPVWNAHETLIRMY